MVVITKRDKKKNLSYVSLMIEMTVLEVKGFYSCGRTKAISSVDTETKKRAILFTYASSILSYYESVS